VKVLDHFNVEFEFPLGELDASRTDLLLPLVERYSSNGSAAWRAGGRSWAPELGSRYATRKHSVDVPAAAFKKVIDREWSSAGVSRDRLNPDGVGWKTEHVGVHVELARRQSMEVEVDALLADPEAQQEKFFVALCELLLPRKGLYLPRYDGPFGSQHMITEMALERDYAMYGEPPFLPQVILAKSIAPLLPRLRFWPSDPDGLPDRLGWLNYWSEGVAARLGFPDAQKDAELLPLSYRTKSGAWLVKLTHDPLDLERPDHVEAFARAYWRFDKIGRRMQPTAKQGKARAKRADAQAANAEGLKLFVVRERDEGGKWWNAAFDPIHAQSAEEALRIYFARIVRGGAPRSGDTLAKLRKAYDEVAIEVGITMSAHIDVAEAEAGDPSS
jgi:hypothetical protein